MSDQLDLLHSIAARDAALTQVRDNAGPWFDQALAYLARLRQWTGTGEDVRVMVAREIGPPHHHNVWGGVIRTALMRGYLVRTGERRQMRSVRAHARTTDVYRSR